MTEGVECMTISDTLNWTLRQTTTTFQAYLTFGEEVSFTGSTRLSSLHLSEASWFHFTYDMGSVTQVLLRVDAVGETTVDTSLSPH